jgi:HEAT repeat protein
VRATALGALERLGRLDDPTLVVGLADASPVVRRRAARLAATHTEIDLAVALGDAEGDVVEAAAWACGEHELPRPHIVARLSSLAISHDEPLVREAAVAALGAIGDLAGLPAILAATRDKPAIRRRATIALTPFEGPEVEAAFARALTDRDWQVREAAETLLRDDHGSSS